MIPFTSNFKRGKTKQKKKKKMQLVASRGMKGHERTFWGTEIFCILVHCMCNLSDFILLSTYGLCTSPQTGKNTEKLR